MTATHDHEAPATLEFAASLEFEPCEDLEQPPSGEEWQRLENPHLINARVAYLICKKTKPQLVAMIEEMVEGGDTEVHERIMDGLRDAAEFFDWFRDMITTAEARMFSAGAVYALKVEDKQ